MKYETREQIPQEYKWKLSDIYVSEQDCLKDLNCAEELCAKIVKMKGTIKDAAALEKILQLNEKINLYTEKVYVFARMQRDQDNANSDAQALADKAMSLIAKVTEATSFIDPEILELDKATVDKWVEEREGLKLYKFFLEEMFRLKEHILSDKEEALLALTVELCEGPKHTFTMLNNADLRLGTIIDEKGDEVELTKGNYIGYMESKDRRVRRDAFTAMYSAFGSLINTISGTYGSSLKKDVFRARARKYSSSLDKALAADNVPEAVYTNLIDSVSKGLPAFKKYLELRKDMLKLDELHMYDLYTPLVEQDEKEYSYEEAVKMVLDGLEILGPDYRKILEEGFAGGWVDVYETKGKTGGAYSWGCYGTHPYVLLNFDGKLNDVFTIAHEMGHAVHTYLSNKNQPYIYSEYKIFVAEVASTVNEILLMNYLIKNAKDKNERIYLNNHYLEEFRGTVYRQTMFAEFEKIVHEMAENGEPITPDSLSSVYYELNEKYFAPVVKVDEDIAKEWARIPHFYNAFYVYKYATGFSAATAIANAIMTEGEPAIKRYMEFLSGGGSDYPLELLKKTGVDLNTPEPVDAAIKVFENVVEDIINSKE